MAFESSSKGEQVPQKSKFTKFQLHNILFKEIYSNPRYAIDLFRLILSPSEYRSYNWKTLKTEDTVYIDPAWREKRTDLFFSVKYKNSGEAIHVAFLLEHKSYQDDELLQQLLHYQATIYATKKRPIVPILVYHGREKDWKGPLNFQDSLTGMTSKVHRNFGKNVLNFHCRLLNLNKLEALNKKRLTTTPILYTMSRIWRMDDQAMRELLKTSSVAKNKVEHTKLLGKALRYLGRYRGRKLNLGRLEKIEREVVPNEGDRVMSALRPSLQIDRDEWFEEGLEKGREEGLEKGREEGRIAERKKIACDMLASGADLKFVAKATGLTLQEVKELNSKD